MGGLNILETIAKKPIQYCFLLMIFLNKLAEVYEANLKHSVETRDISNLNLDIDFPKLNIDVVLGDSLAQTSLICWKRAGTEDEVNFLSAMIRVVDYTTKNFYC